MNKLEQDWFDINHPNHYKVILETHKNDVSLTLLNMEKIDGYTMRYFMNRVIKNDMFVPELEWSQSTIHKFINRTIAYETPKRLVYLGADYNPEIDDPDKCVTFDINGSVCRYPVLSYLNSFNPISSDRLLDNISYMDIFGIIKTYSDEELSIIDPRWLLRFVYRLPEFYESIEPRQLKSNLLNRDYHDVWFHFKTKDMCALFGAIRDDAVNKPLYSYLTSGCIEVDDVDPTIFTSSQIDYIKTELRSNQFPDKDMTKVFELKEQELHIVHRVNNNLMSRSDAILSSVNIVETRSLITNKKKFDKADEIFKHIYKTFGGKGLMEFVLRKTLVVDTIDKSIIVMSIILKHLTNHALNNGSIKVPNYPITDYMNSIPDAHCSDSVFIDFISNNAGVIYLINDVAFVDLCKPENGLLRFIKHDTYTLINKLSQTPEGRELIQHIL